MDNDEKEELIISIANLIQNNTFPKKPFYVDFGMFITSFDRKSANKMNNYIKSDSFQNRDKKMTKEEKFEVYKELTTIGIDAVYLHNKQFELEELLLKWI